MVDHPLPPDMTICALGAKLRVRAIPCDEELGRKCVRLLGVDDRNREIRVTLSPSDALALVRELTRCVDEDGTVADAGGGA